MKSRCVSITGASGFIGGHAARAFRTRGWGVRAIVRRGRRTAVPTDIQSREADLLDTTALAAAFAGSDVVVHAAGVVRAPTSEAFASVNVDGTRTVVAAANAVGARLVHLSSLAASGPGTVARPVREDDAPSPVNAYGRSKLAGERIVRETAAVPWIILRPSAVYGPGDAAFLPLVRLARRGLFLLATPEATPFSFIYVDDVADAVVRAAESAATKETLFLGHPHAETAASLLSGIAACLGKRYRPMLIPPFIVRIAGWAGDLAWAIGRRPAIDSSRVAEFNAPGFVCDVTRAQRQLGFSAAVGLPTGLARTVEWYRQQGLV